MAGSALRQSHTTCLVRPTDRAGGGVLFRCDRDQSGRPGTTLPLQSCPTLLLPSVRVVLAKLRSGIVRHRLILRTHSNLHGARISPGVCFGSRTLANWCSGLEGNIEGWNLCACRIVAGRAIEEEEEEEVGAELEGVGAWLLRRGIR